MKTKCDYIDDNNEHYFIREMTRNKKRLLTHLETCKQCRKKIADLQNAETFMAVTTPSPDFSKRMNKLLKKITEKKIKQK